ncbi:uncharacterized protein F5147DRAFT_687226 [Suillus discolor]|uniref:Uncharacterized protein n=1 Tax=Suillus discolor TaxID=1912936 RepID=A0A9P7FB38_9AGAM|nr:uncharacterized protein F5147DRAFT_687226 [Suillus discolor]KAG2111319.1 hypothetical protein F5147DRAFT_687226 [Suillus discolor]
MMFTSRLTILALLAFLVGANAACATCQETLSVNGVVTYKLVTSSWNMMNGFVDCNYMDKKGDEVTCEYEESGVFKDGDSNMCPQNSRKNIFGC